jgi:nucleotide-binding universal stress UspA family protein
LYKVILVPLDGSPLAEQALPHAVEIARAFGARLTLFSVVESYQLYPQPGVIGPVLSVQFNIDEETSKTSEYLRGLADKLRADGIDVVVEVRQGDPAAEICDYAKSIGADLIVMSTHGRSGIRRWVYGSVADRILRSANVPVLLVRALTDEEAQ